MALRLQCSALRCFISLLLLTGLPAMAAQAPVAPQPAADEFSFVVLGDSQFHKPLVFNRIIDQVRLLYPAFVVQVGDMIEGYAGDLQQMRSEWQRFEAQIQPLAPVPFMPVPGNHDLYNAQRRSDPQYEALYREIWGETYYSFGYRNSRFVVLNTDAPDTERRLGPQQYQWLEKTLAAATEPNLFLFMHRPPDTLEDAQSLHELLVQYPVRYVFYGHHHHYHYREQDGIRYVMTNAAANSALEGPETGSMDHFLHVSVRNGNISLAVIRADGIMAPTSVQPADNYDLFEISRKLAPASVMLAAASDGTSSLVIPLQNPTARSLNLYVSCTSADQRWKFTPEAIAPLQLDAGSSRTLALTVSHEPTRIPETLPECHIRLPFMKTDGQWLDYEVTVRTTLPGATPGAQDR